MELNIRGQDLMTKSVLGEIIERGAGSVINVSSGAAAPSAPPTLHLAVQTAQSMTSQIVEARQFGVSWP